MDCCNPFQIKGKNKSFTVSVPIFIRLCVNVLCTCMRVTMMEKNVLNKCLVQFLNALGTDKPICPQ